MPLLVRNGVATPEGGERLGVVPLWSPGVLRMTLAALALAVVAAWVVWERLAERHEQDVAERFHSEASEIALRIDERFRGYRQVLRGGRALFQASESVERAEWRTYVAGLDLADDYPGIQGVGFSEWLTPAALQAHEQRVREEGFGDYRVWPAGERNAYSAIVMLEPFDWRNQRAFGFDMYSEPVRREAMERAIVSGEGALSGKVTLVQETDEDRQAGVLLYLPLFSDDAPIATAAERRAALRGWVYSPFRMHDLMQGMLGPVGQDIIRLRIYDEVETADALLYDSHRAREPGSQPRYVFAMPLVLDGRTWQIVIESLGGHAHDDAALQAELIAIVLIGMMFVLVSWSFSITRARAVALERAATHDPLTGVPNRLMFGDLLERTIRLSARYRHRFGLLFVDLDRFKEINDSCGHQIGDRVLVRAVRRMRACVRASDTLSRHGGDEFIVLLPEIASGEELDIVAEKIRRALEEPFDVDGRSLRISSSIGVVRYPDDGSDADTLLVHADAAMYRAKAEGRNRSSTFAR
ncbi:MAG TPA: CHASE domain-containing protein [Rhodocyclaceae bacterium]|nr:CHASE domain-containing protein [Rhodocyclaceae bacterium]